MGYSLEVTTIGKVATVAINRPDIHNAFDDALVADLTDTLTKCERDANIRVVVLTGTGSTFSAGADLNWMRGMAKASESDNRVDAERLAALSTSSTYFQAVDRASTVPRMAVVSASSLLRYRHRGRYGEVRPDRSQARPRAGRDSPL